MFSNCEFIEDDRFYPNCEIIKKDRVLNLELFTISEVDYILFVDKLNR